MRIRKIDRRPTTGRNHYVVDTCFLVNKYIPTTIAPQGKQFDRIKASLDWWQEIDAQPLANAARVYIPDLCIAEAFKVLAKKYYEEHWFPSAVALNNARNRLRRDISLPLRTLRAAKRRILYHDISTSRDIIIAVDRFYELFHKHGKKVSLPDLILLSTAKYLVDFYDIPRRQLHIVTLDNNLWSGTKKIQELPNAYDPTKASDSRDRVFR